MPSHAGLLMLMILGVLRQCPVAGYAYAMRHAGTSWLCCYSHTAQHAVLPSNQQCRECYGIVDVYPDAIHIRGVDTFASEQWPLPPLAAAAARAAAAAAEPPQPAAAPGVAVRA